MSTDCIPVYEGAYAQHLTVQVGATVAGCRFLGPLTSFQSDPLALASSAGGGNIQCAGYPSAGGAVSGVSKWDGPTGGGKIGIIRGAGVILPVIAGAAVAVGDELKVTTAGKVIPWATSGVKVGRAHTATTTGDGDTILVELYSHEGTPA